MRLYISPGMRRITISSSLRHSDSVRLKFSSHLSHRRLFLVLLLSAFLLPLLFITTAMITLDNSTDCDGQDCFHLGRPHIWYFPFRRPKRHSSPPLPPPPPPLSPEQQFPLDPPPLQDVDVEQRKKRVGSETPDTLADLIALAKKNNYGTEAIISMMKAMVQRYEEKVKVAKLQRSLFRHFASKGVPKGLHCLSLRLTAEYASNLEVQWPLPALDRVDRLTDNSLHHFIFITDNVLAASVVVASIVQNAINKSRIVIHVVTDEMTYGAIHGWFATNDVGDATVEVRSIQQIAKSLKMTLPIVSSLDNSPELQAHLYGDQAVEEELMDPSPVETPKIEPKRIRFTPWMSQLRMYMPEVFPDLDKIVFLDDDVVVQRDLAALWDIPMDGKVNAAVETCKSGDFWLASKRFKSYLNFSHPLIAANFDPESCAWAYGMNIFDLKAWRASNITEKYHHWQKLNAEWNMTMWRLGTLPPALIAFQGHMKPIGPSWHLLGLGYQPDINVRAIENAAVIHYNGPAKPWMDMAIEDFKPYWTRYVDFNNKFIESCNIYDVGPRKDSLYARE